MVLGSTRKLGWPFVRTVRFFNALSGVRRSIKPDVYLSSFLRHQSSNPARQRRPPPPSRRSGVCYDRAHSHPPVVGPRCVTIARTPPGRRSGGRARVNSYSYRVKSVVTLFTL